MGNRCHHEYNLSYHRTRYHPVTATSGRLPEGFERLPQRAKDIFQPNPPDSHLRQHYQASLCLPGHSMGVELGFLCLLVVGPGSLVSGIIIDPQIPDSASRVQVHCLASNDVIQIKNPFKPMQLDSDEKFIAMEWYKLQGNATDIQLLEFLKNKPVQDKIADKFKQFEFWGLQINNVNVSDSGSYEARLLHLSVAAADNRKLVQIVVARPPVLASEKLTLTRTVNEYDRSVRLSCGQLSDQGSPPVSVLLKAENGTALPTVYKGGFVEHTVSSQEGESAKFTCEIDMTSPAASCISSEDMPRWQGVVSETSKTHAADADRVGIIAGVAAAVVLIVIVVVIVIVIIIRKKKRKAKTYNTQEHEQKGVETPGKTTESLLQDYENPYDKPYVPAKPIYKGPTAPSPYMVSQLSQGIADPDSEYEEMECSNGKQPQPGPTSGLFVKRGAEKDNKKQARKSKKENNNEKLEVKENPQPKPPRAKPRSIFLTPSMEELDKISQAVAGGDRSQPSSGMGTQV